MSSSVFFKFRSQKEPTKIAFDGTGISVFELKREIIRVAGLGTGLDFDLSIYEDGTNEGMTFPRYSPSTVKSNNYVEYDDDTTIIPRTTTVIARRTPAKRPGQGRAARYVRGQAPVTAKNSYRTEASHNSASQQPKSSTPHAAALAMSQAQTEEEKLAAMLQANSADWAAQQEKMAHAKPVYNNNHKGKPQNVPDHEPPPGYICYRCHQKGHWIQACPTNDDPNFEAKPRVKRTTGIPKSFLKTVAAPEAPVNDGLTDDRLAPSVMINEKGEYVVAVADNATWQKFSAKAQVAKEQEKKLEAASKELQDRGLACSIDQKLFVDPVKTPCCGKTYCRDCIKNALFDDDLTCPNCDSTDIIPDDLIADEETRDKVTTYEQEQEAEKKVAAEKAAEQKANEESAESPSANPSTPAAAASIDTSATKSEETLAAKPTSASNTAANSPAPSAEKQDGSKSPNPKKRAAEEELKNDRVPAAPAAMRKTNSSQVQQQQSTPAPVTNANDQDFIKQMNALASSMGMGGQGMPAYNFPPGMMGGMNNMPFNPMMGMGMGMPMMPNGGFGNMPFNPMMGMGMGMPNMMPNGGFNHNMNYNNQPNGNYGNGMNGFGGNNNNFQPPTGPRNQFNNNNQRQGGAAGGGPVGGFANQQKTVFSEPFPNEESDAYMRRPVNPHRHQNRQRRVRPSDYTEL